MRSVSQNIIEKLTFHRKGPQPLVKFFRSAAIGEMQNNKM